MARPRERFVSYAIAAILLCCGAMLLAKQAYLGAKAAVAGVLISRTQEQDRPWPWADMTLLGELEVPRLELRRAILSGATTESLAFGVGHLDGSAPLNGDGNCVLAGHRGGVFKFLGALQIGDELRVHTGDTVREWVVAETWVVSADDLAALQETDSSTLTLITCWPIDGLWSSEERLIVRCEGLPPLASRRGERVPSACVPS